MSCCATLGVLRRVRPGAIASVVEDADEVDVLERLDSLVRKSLVVVNHSAARTRYGMFETIRQFAEDRVGRARAD